MTADGCVVVIVTLAVADGATVVIKICKWKINFVDKEEGRTD